MIEVDLRLKEKDPGRQWKTEAAGFKFFLSEATDESLTDNRNLMAGGALQVSDKVLLKLVAARWHNVTPGWQFPG